jgi:hypothetical protein
MKDSVEYCIIIIVIAAILFFSHNYVKQKVHDYLNLEQAFQESLMRHGKK